MSTFLGKYEAKADVKGRIFIPAAYRKILPEGEKDRVVIRMDLDFDCLNIYPESEWEKIVAEIRGNLNIWKKKDRFFKTQFVSEAEYLDIDSQGRILLSKRHLKSISIENSEVVFVGSVEYFSVWNKSKFEKLLISREEYSNEISEIMSNKPLAEDEE